MLKISGGTESKKLLMRAESGLVVLAELDVAEVRLVE